MKIINKKQINFFAWFLLISSLGALWLSLAWFHVVFKGDSPGAGTFSSINVFYYYLFNSGILIFSAILFSLRHFKSHSVLAVILAISVTVSLFIFREGINLFNATVTLGVYGGIMYGGPILVPLFLGAVYISGFRAIKHIFGKIAYVSKNS